MNKNLNLLPTKTKYSEKNLNQDSENFYRIKLTSHFGINGTRKKQTEEAIFKPSNDKWLAKDTYHTTKPFFDLASKDIVVKKSEHKKILKSNFRQKENLI